MEIEREPDTYETGFGELSAEAVQAEASPKWWEQALATGVSVYQQERFRKENIRRMQQGQAPLSVEQYKKTLPAAQVEVGMTPQMRNILLIGGIGAALLVFAAMRR